MTYTYNTTIFSLKKLNIFFFLIVIFFNLVGYLMYMFTHHLQLFRKLTVFYYS